MKIKEHIDGLNIVLSIEGNFDENTSLEIASKIDSVISGGINTLYLELEAVQYLSSAGISVLIVAHKKAVKGGKRVIISGMSDKVKEILQTVGILPLFPRREGGRSLWHIDLKPI